MPLDEFAQHVSLDATAETMTPEQIQNSKGMRSLPPLRDLEQGTFLSLMAIQTSRELTPQEYFTLLGNIKTQLADLNPSAQLLAGNEVPTFPDRQINLHATAHMRVEKLSEPTPEPEE